ncbi:MAG: AAA family ATPase [Planctomycetes bacterium]|nr:AAA family ATPase [Planctomycetota bacterium]
MLVIEDVILACLQQSATPLTDRQIRRRINERNLVRVSDALLNLQSSKMVRRSSRGTWFPIGGTRPGTPTTFQGGAQQESQQFISDFTQQHGPAKETRSKSAGSTSPWAMFRRLCMFYAECARLEERSQVRSFADREGNDFVSIPVEIDWSRLSNGHDVVIAVRDEWDAFLRTAPIEAKNEIFYLGGPVDVYVHKDGDTTSQFLSPVFIIPVRIKLGNGTLRLRAAGRIEVNQGWLQKRLKNAGKRQLFMKQMRLAEDELPFDDGTIRSFVPNMEEAYQGLWSCYRKWWQEPADIRQPVSEPNFTDITESGLRNRAVLMSPQPLKFTRRLVEELKAIVQMEDDKLDQTALAPLFRQDYSFANDPENEQWNATSYKIGEFCLLNPVQRDAVKKALNQRLTVITGPPGTGKSTVVSHILANAAIHGQKALFASRNHQALEAVEPRLNAMLEGDEMLVLRPSRPFGDNRQQFEWQQAMALLLSKPRRDGAIERLADLRNDLFEKLTERENVEDAIQNMIEHREQLGKLEAHLADVFKAVSSDHQSIISNQDTTNCCSSEQVNAAERQLSMLLSLEPVGWLRPFLIWWWRIRIRKCQRKAQQLVMAVNGVVQTKTDTTNQHVNGNVNQNELVTALNYAGKLSLSIELTAKIKSIENILHHSEPLADQTEKLSKTESDLESLTKRTLQAISESAGADLTPQQRQKFAEISAGLANHGPPTTQWPTRTAFDSAFEKIVPELLKSFPIWCVSNLTVARAAPLIPAVFDLVVIDEASQCDIGSIVPLLFRAKQAVIVGDPMQLKHVASIAKQTELQLRKKYGLIAEERFERFTHVENSCYQLASSSEHLESTIQLTGHYRCDPQIAEYCNNTFYNKTLNILTNTERLARPKAAKEHGACMWTNCVGDIKKASSGCYCTKQVAIIIAELQRLEEEKFIGTVGVITPFRAHANRLRDAVEQELGEGIPPRWRFMVDTVDGFQGDERDIILFSLVGGPSMPDGSKSFLYRNRNRFNVAASRARSFLHIIGDREWALQSGVPFLTALVQICERSTGQKDGLIREDLIGPVWEPRVAEALRDRGLAIKQQYHTCGYYLDFALLREDLKLNVEVDGETYHRDASGARKFEDIYRDLILRAAGWKIIRFWVYQLRDDFDGCIDKVVSNWENRV